ncbi:MAG: riboflavin biosynthesis protein RibF [Prevotella sp.]|nr:riboflavin biosynthesis protein RibF [Prevotella sp.]
MDSYAATIGMFDGVHRGHQYVLRQLVQTARGRGLQSLVVTFDHAVRRDAVLTPLDAKLSLLSKTGVDRIETLPFTDELKQMTACQFMQQVLRDRLGVRVLLTGYDNRFGHNREEGFDDYVRYGRQLGIEVLALSEYKDADGAEAESVSSSLIRRLISEGRVAEAARCLGYQYTVSGRVTHGEHMGTQLGFPTANIVLSDPRQLVPAHGAYAVTVSLENSLEQKHAMMNIGSRPTFDGRQVTLEAHILRLHEDLYGQQLQVSFVERLRDERRFDSPEALRQQLLQDAEMAEKILKSDE